MNLKDEEIYKKIEEIYKTEKGKPFITHLIRSFLPMTRSTFMLSNEKGKKMKCAITGTPLIDREEVVAFKLDNMDAVLKNFSDRILNKTTENIVVDKFKGKLFAVESEKSDKLLCLEAVQQLLNFVQSEFLKENKHIRYIVRDERIKSESKDNSNPTINNQTKSDKPQPKQSQPKQAMIHSTTSLSDFDSLKQLKEKLENEGK